MYMLNFQVRLSPLNKKAKFLKLLEHLIKAVDMLEMSWLDMSLFKQIREISSMFKLTKVLGIMMKMYDQTRLTFCSIPWLEGNL